MPEGSSFTIKDLGVIAKMLGLRPGDMLEVKRDRADPNRLLLLRIPQEESGSNVQGSSQPS